MAPAFGGDKNERTAFCQLNFIDDIGVEGGMVSQCTACSLANLRAPVSVHRFSLFVPLIFVYLFATLKQEYGVRDI
jgi:hypothetical protein